MIAPTTNTGRTIPAGADGPSRLRAALDILFSHPNVGPMIRPTARLEYLSSDRERYPLPPQLMSHNDQQSVWQAQGAEESAQGWGGRIGDLVLGNNGDALFACISASGKAVFLTRQNAVQHQLSRSGEVPISALANGPHGAVGSGADAAAARTVASGTGAAPRHAPRQARRTRPACLTDLCGTGRLVIACGTTVGTRTTTDLLRALAAPMQETPSGGDAR